ncbi:MAG: hypothetical protein AAFX07_03810 [Pseudomonadota bacterium]
MNAILAVLMRLLGAAGLGGSGGGSDSASASGDGADTGPTGANLADPANAYYAEDGRLVLEAENGDANGNWVETTVDGETAMLWDGSTNSYGQAQDGQELSFEFVTEEAGQYYIAMHAGRVKDVMSASDAARHDTGNDAWVRLTDLDSGAVILQPTKLFTNLGNTDEELNWGKTFDKSHNFSDPKVNLEANTSYRLDIVGRSDGHVIDRITLQKDGFLRDTEIAESDAWMDALTLPFVPVDDRPIAEEEDEALELF